MFPYRAIEGTLLLSSPSLPCFPTEPSRELCCCLPVFCVSLQSHRWSFVVVSQSSVFLYRAIEGALLLSPSLLCFHTEPLRELCCCLPVFCVSLQSHRGSFVVVSQSSVFPYRAIKGALLLSPSFLCFSTEPSMELCCCLPVFCVSLQSHRGSFVVVSQSSVFLYRAIEGALLLSPSLPCFSIEPSRELCCCLPVFCVSLQSHRGSFVVVSKSSVFLYRAIGGALLLSPSLPCFSTEPSMELCCCLPVFCVSLQSHRGSFVVVSQSSVFPYRTIEGALLLSPSLPCFSTEPSRELCCCLQVFCVSVQSHRWSFVVVSQSSVFPYRTIEGALLLSPSLPCFCTEPSVELCCCLPVFRVSLQSHRWSFFVVFQSSVFLYRAIEGALLLSPSLPCFSTEP